MTSKISKKEDTVGCEDFFAWMRGVISECHCDSEVAERYLRRLEEGEPARDDNPESHFCVYFAAYDPQTGRVFVGLHRKSGRWLVNGGHVDRNELPDVTVRREMSEEWGQKTVGLKVDGPLLLTITEIDNRPIQACRTHFDIWYFVPVSEAEFYPDPELLDTEFSEMGWYSLVEAKELLTDVNTSKAIDFISQNLLAA
ncbi:MAG: NUDIX domain-containing protein [bacterium]